MIFAPNPLSLSVTEPAFESWLRDSDFLETLDQRTTDLHRAAAAAAAVKPSDSDGVSAFMTPRGAVFIVWRLLSSVWILLSLFTFSPFSKLGADDFSVETPPWTFSFLGSLDSYSFPSSSSQARLRVQENVKRFAPNYATLSVFFFVCSLYKIPISLLGVVACLSLWEGFERRRDQWFSSKHPLIKQFLAIILKCVIAVVLVVSKLQSALFWALCVSYAAIILHASFRNLTSFKK
ncbi:hypothetical protein M569_05683, partial [Genlisea aurea]